MSKPATVPTPTPSDLALMAPSEALHAQSSIATSLLERVRRHESAAWERMTRLYTPLVYSWVRRAGVNQSDAADVVQDVFLEVTRSILRFRRTETGDTFSGWVRTITTRRAADHLRKQRDPDPAGGTAAQLRLEQLADPHANSSSSTDATPDPHDSSTELVRRGLDLIRCEFQDRTWLAFENTALKGRSTAEVAAELGMSMGAVYVAKSRVTKRLREELDGLI